MVGQVEVRLVIGGEGGGWIGEVVGCWCLVLVGGRDVYPNFLGNRVGTGCNFSPPNKFRYVTGNKQVIKCLYLYLMNQVNVRFSNLHHRQSG